MQRRAPGAGWNRLESAVAGPGLPAVPPGLCGPQSTGGSVGTSVSIGAQRGGWAGSRILGCLSCHCVRRLRPGSLSLQLCAGSPASPQMMRRPLGESSGDNHDSVSGVRAGEELWPVSSPVSLLPEGSRFRLSFSNVWEAKSQIHDSVPLACVFVGLAGNKSPDFYIPP